MLVPDLIKPMPVPTMERGRIIGTDDTKPTGPRAKLRLNMSIPTTGFKGVNSSNNKDVSMDAPLPITKDC